MSHPIGIRHLQAFQEVARSGSFTRAAEHLHLTQSALTATIKQLESWAGLTLFDRTTRRVLLSAEGERFLPVAERLCSDFSAALTDLRARAQLQQGQVSVAGSPSVVTRVLPGALAAFQQQHSGIRVFIHDESAGSIEQRVLSNRADLAIAGNHSQQPELEYAPLLRDRYGVVVPCNHPLAQRETLDWHEIDEEELLLLSQETGIRAQLERFTRKGEISLTLDNAVLEATNPAGLAALISQGLGLSVLPALAADTHSFTGLTFIPLSNPVKEREICIITRGGRALSPAAAALLDTVRRHLLSVRLPEGVRPADEQTLVNSDE